MSISIVEPIIAGNGLRIHLSMPDGADYFRLLKAAGDVFAGPFDLSAASLVTIADQSPAVDVTGLQNGVTVWYKAYYHIEATDTWEASNSATGTPQALYEDDGVDVQSFLRERLELGLREEVDRGNLIADLGYVQVFSAAPAVDENISLPVVTVILESSDPSEYGIGNDISGDVFLEDSDEWLESVGMLERHSINITGWSLNSDERLALRKALRRVLMANWGLMDSLGIILPEATFADNDALNGEFGAPMYMVNCTFRCQAPVIVGRRYGAGDVVTDVTVDDGSGPDDVLRVALSGAQVQAPFAVSVTTSMVESDYSAELIVDGVSLGVITGTAIDVGFDISSNDWPGVDAVGGDLLVIVTIGSLTATATALLAPDNALFYDINLLTYGGDILTYG